ncbi:Uncharacterised protein [Vibrio cholerae]|nr:Uncharacterised protein [Vibrio cholerae]
MAAQYHFTVLGCEQNPHTAPLELGDIECDLFVTAV